MCNYVDLLNLYALEQIYNSTVLKEKNGDA